MFYMEQNIERARLNGKSTILYRSIVRRKSDFKFVDETCLFDTMDEAKHEGELLLNLYNERAKAEADGFPVQSTDTEGLDNGLTPD